MKKSAGILLFRFRTGVTEVFLVHPGGPFWKNKDAGVWSIPKGEFAENEDALIAAKREFEEETGFACHGDFIQLEPIKLKSGKLVYPWAVQQDIDPALLKSNLFEMEWPPKSGRMQSFPEIDRGEWFNIPGALQKINASQAKIIEELLLKIGSSKQ